jgi:hypothetical protein
VAPNILSKVVIETPQHYLANCASFAADYASGNVEPDCFAEAVFVALRN